MRIVLQLLRDHHLYGKFSKCEFWLTEVRFLGHVVLAPGVSVDPKKVEAVMSWERLKSVFEIHSFLGLVGYYKRFIEDFSRLAAPMTRLTVRRSSLIGMTGVEEEAHYYSYLDILGQGTRVHSVL